MSTMMRVVAEQIGRVGVSEVSVPAPGPGQVLVRTALAGICGSDTHAVAGHHPLLSPPYYPGHEATGTVAEVGPDVAFPAVGQRVMLKPNVCCGECANCRAGRTNTCQDLRWIGCDPSGALPGAMADYLLAPAGNLYAVPDEVTDRQAVLVECLATGVHAARIAGDVTGARVVVLGAGTIGLFAVMAARRAGAGTIVVTDLDIHKRERALRHGADVAVDAAATSAPWRSARSRLWRSRSVSTMVPAPARRAAITANSPIVPAPSTTTLAPVTSPAMRAAWTPVARHSTSTACRSVTSSGTAYRLPAGARR